MLLSPATSVTLHVNAPFVRAAAVPLQVTAPTPERTSLTVPFNDNAADVTVVPFAGVVILRPGAVLSTFTIADAAAWLPALSAAVPLIVCEAVSVETTTCAGHEATPLVASEQVKVMVAAALSQPAAFGIGLIAAVTIGGVVSLRMMGEMVVLPAPLVPIM